MQQLYLYVLTFSKMDCFYTNKQINQEQVLESSIGVY